MQCYHAYTQYVEPCNLVRCLLQRNTPLMDHLCTKPAHSLINDPAPQSHLLIKDPAPHPPPLSCLSFGTPPLHRKPICVPSPHPLRLQAWCACSKTGGAGVVVGTGKGVVMGSANKGGIWAVGWGWVKGHSLKDMSEFKDPPAWGRGRDLCHCHYHVVPAAMSACRGDWLRVMRGYLIEFTSPKARALFLESKCQK